MKQLFWALLFISLTNFHPYIVAASNEENETYIYMLDSLLEKKNDFERDKLMKIAELKQKDNNAASLTERYLYNTLLYDEFATYNADSALKYINRNLEIAQSSGNKEWEIKSKIDKSNLLTGTGLLKEAEEIMTRINPAQLPENVLTDYYGQMIYLYSHLGNYAGGSVNEYYIKERAYKDSIMAVIPPSHHDFLWYKGWDILGTDKSDDSLIPALKQKLEEGKQNTRQDAKNAYILSKLYEWKGDRENFKKYMALSAIIDVKTANAEIASLEDLARIMFEDGDIDRAYSYINYSLTKALSFPNRVRAFGMARTQDDINKAYQERNRKQEHRITTFLIIVCILATILVGAISVIILQNRRLRKQGDNLDDANKTLNRNMEELSEAHRQLNDVNSRLKELNESLKAKNEELNEANYVKEEYIGYIFTICSNYIRKLEDFRKSIHVKAKTRKYREIEDATASTEMMKDELKDFYHSFDTIFLHIYPDFVNDFNSLLQDDKKITPKEGELLNTELRIYALVRLGITDSVKIAEFLHCSSQTVYNNRFRVRNKAIIPKEVFAETVRTLGKFMDRPS